MGVPCNFKAIESLRETIFWWKKEAREFANDCDMGGESCSLGGDECSMDLIIKFLSIYLSKVVCIHQNTHAEGTNLASHNAVLYFGDHYIYIFCE